MEKLKLSDKLKVKKYIIKRKVLEFIRFDSKFMASMLLGYKLTKYFIEKIFKDDFYALLTAGDIFRQINFPWSRQFATKVLIRVLKKHGSKKTGTEITSIVMKENDEETPRLKQSIINDDRPFDKRLLILSPPQNGAKGILVVKFTNYFKQVATIFDFKRLCNDYILVVEPSSAGYFDLDILCLIRDKTPIIVQSSEKIDYALLEQIDTNLIPINLGANCWVDERVFRPIKNTELKYDIVFVAITADFKRHYHLLETLGKCKNKYKIKVAFVIVPWPKPVEFVKQQAQYYGVLDNIDFFESITQKELNELLNQSKCYLLLSKKEGFNKGIIEAMHAGTPGFLLEGFNYGQKYDYINSLTGGFIPNNGLKRFMEGLVGFKKSDYSSRQWVLNNMSSGKSALDLIEKLKKIEMRFNIDINKELAVKINSPDLDYKDKKYWDLYKPYYRNLNGYLVD